MSDRGPQIDEVWQRSYDGSRVRIKGFSRRDGWVRVREVGGGRERSSYPPVAFTNGAFIRVVEQP